MVRVAPELRLRFAEPALCGWEPVAEPDALLRLAGQLADADHPAGAPGSAARRSPIRRGSAMLALFARRARVLRVLHSLRRVVVSALPAAGLSRVTGIDGCRGRRRRGASAGAAAGRRGAGAADRGRRSHDRLRGRASNVRHRWRAELRDHRPLCRRAPPGQRGDPLRAAQRGIRYYSHRTTIRFGSIPSDHLDLALGELQRLGYRPYLVVEDWEEEAFRRQFAGRQAVDALSPGPEYRLPLGNIRIYALAR